MRGDVARASAEVAALATDPAMIENRYYHVACAQVAELAGERNVALHAYRSAMAFAGERDRQTILVRLRNLEERAAHEPDVRTLGR
jgi:predicted RNA polymerase sigma factor